VLGVAGRERKVCQSQDLRCRNEAPEVAVMHDKIPRNVRTDGQRIPFAARPSHKGAWLVGRKTEDDGRIQSALDHPIQRHVGNLGTHFRRIPDLTWAWGTPLSRAKEDDLIVPLRRPALCPSVAKTPATKPPQRTADHVSGQQRRLQQSAHFFIRLSQSLSRFEALPSERGAS